MKPDYGMTSYELLSRGSLFPVKSSGQFPKKYHWIGAAHVTHPYHFMNLYPDERYQWLQDVTDDETIYSLQVHEV